VSRQLDYMLWEKVAMVFQAAALAVTCVIYIAAAGHLTEANKQIDQAKANLEAHQQYIDREVYRRNGRGS